FRDQEHREETSIPGPVGSTIRADNNTDDITGATVHSGLERVQPSVKLYARQPTILTESATHDIQSSTVEDDFQSLNVADESKKLDLADNG
ncbi:MAG: hypothetical protein Q9224_007622, partial [Gallowayella concinna]